MSDFNVGDVVVCVDDSLPADLFTCTGCSPFTGLKIGDHYTVTGLMPCWDGLAILVNGEAPHTCTCCEGENGWLPARFRKLDAPKTEIADRIRACRPVSPKVPA